MSEFLKCEFPDRIALVTLRRPERLNAMGNEMGRQFDELMVRLAQDEGVRVVVLTGEGRAFCAGADMERLGEFAKDRERSAKLPAVGEARGAFRALVGHAPAEVLTRYNCPQALPQPVIAAVNGPCAGIGLGLAVMCDIRFGSTDAMFVAPFARRGLIAETGLASSLSSLVGIGRASDLLLTGRRVDAQEAFRIGLLDRLCAPDRLIGDSLAYARDLADHVSPRSARVIKRQLWLARSQSFAEAATVALDETKLSMASEDFQEGLAHYKEKRAPQFTGR